MNKNRIENEDLLNQLKQLTETVNNMKIEEEKINSKKAKNQDFKKNIIKLGNYMSKYFADDRKFKSAIDLKSVATNNQIEKYKKIVVYGDYGSKALRSPKEIELTKKFLAEEQSKYDFLSSLKNKQIQKLDSNVEYYKGFIHENSQLSMNDNKKK